MRLRESRSVDSAVDVFIKFFGSGPNALLLTIFTDVSGAASSYSVGIGMETALPDILRRDNSDKEQMHCGNSTLLEKLA